MTNKSKRGGLRTPSGGRPPKPAGEKYQPFPLKLPPHQIEWLRQHKAQTGQAMGAFIVEAIERAMQDADTS
jgi:hypothetical protein